MNSLYETENCVGSFVWYFGYNGTENTYKINIFLPTTDSKSLN